ncbi:MAG: hypothetical protein ACI93R_003272 [Flavobacteriales bacterium]|jgi:hypothetical protein
MNNLIISLIAVAVGTLSACANGWFFYSLLNGGVVAICWAMGAVLFQCYSYAIARKLNCVKRSKKTLAAILMAAPLCISIYVSYTALTSIINNTKEHANTAKSSTNNTIKLNNSLQQLLAANVDSSTQAVRKDYRTQNSKITKQSLLITDRILALQNTIAPHSTKPTSAIATTPAWVLIAFTWLVALLLDAIPISAILITKKDLKPLENKSPKKSPIEKISDRNQIARLIKDPAHPLKATHISLQQHTALTRSERDNLLRVLKPINKV